MSEDKARFFGNKVLLAGGSFVLVVAGLKTAQPLFIPFLFALFLAILGSGPVRFLKNKGLPSTIAVPFVTILMLGIFIGLGALLAQSANAFIGNLPTYRQQLGVHIASMKAWLGTFGLQTYADIIFSESDPDKVLEFTTQLVKGLLEMISQTFLVVVIMMFMLFEAAEFRLKLDVASGPLVDIGRFEKTAYDVQRYLGIKTFTSSVTGILILLWTGIMGVDFPILWALIAFLFNYVPFVGSIVASFPAIFLIILKFDFYSGATLAIGYMVINIGVSNFFEPILMGRRLGLSPLVVFLSLVVWGWIWGPAGALLSVPLTMIVKILLEHSADFGWVAILMGNRPRNTTTISEKK